LGSVPIPFRGNDILRDGAWIFAVNEPAGVVLDMTQRLPPEARLAAEVSPRGDCVAFTTSSIDLRVRQLGVVCFVPNGLQPAEDALQLARSAAIKAGLAAGDWDLSLVGIDSAGRVTSAGPLIDRVDVVAASGGALRGSELRVRLHGGGECSVRVM